MVSKNTPTVLLYAYVVLSLIMLIVIGIQVRLINPHDADEIARLTQAEILIAATFIIGILILFASLATRALVRENQNLTSSQLARPSLTRADKNKERRNQTRPAFDLFPAASPEVTCTSTAK